MLSKTLLVLATGLLFRVSAASAQFFTQDNSKAIALIKSQPLVVLLEEEDPKELKKLAATPSDLAQYKAYVALHNSQLQQLVPKLWQLAPKVEFRPAAELETLRKAKGTKTVVLHYVKRKVGHYDNGRVNDRFNQTFMGATLEASLSLSLEGEGKEDTPFRTPAPLTAMEASDIVFAVKYIQEQITEELAGGNKPMKQLREEAMAQMKADGQRLRSKTLLIDQATVPAKLTAAAIQKLYPYPYQLVSAQEIEAAAMAGDARYTYVRQLSSSLHIIDAADSRLLGVSGATDALSKDNLKNFAFFASFGK